MSVRIYRRKVMACTVLKDANSISKTQRIWRSGDHFASACDYERQDSRDQRALMIGVNFEIPAQVAKPLYHTAEPDPTVSV